MEVKNKTAHPKGIPLEGALWLKQILNVLLERIRQDLPGCSQAGLSLFLEKNLISRWAVPCLQCCLGTPAPRPTFLRPSGGQLPNPGSQTYFGTEERWVPESSY